MKTMTHSHNRITLIGRLQYNPNPGDDASCSLGITTQRSSAEVSGKTVRLTEEHNVQVSGKLAEFCGEHLSTGDLVYVEGPLLSHQWVDREDNHQQVKYVEAEDVKLLEKSPESPDEERPAIESFEPDEELAF